jgi:hypothetical protein
MLKGILDLRARGGGTETKRTGGKDNAETQRALRFAEETQTRAKDAEFTTEGTEDTERKRARNAARNGCDTVNC